MQQPEKLDGLSLEYAFLKALKFDIIGHPDGPFALYEEDRNIVLIFCDSPNIDTINTRLTTNSADLPLNIAKSFSASFSVQNGIVTCVMDGHEGRGDNYPEAAMRAFVKRTNAKIQHRN